MKTDRIILLISGQRTSVKKDKIFTGDLY